MFVHSNIFYFSIEQLSLQRLKYQHKICFKKNLNNLKLKSTPTMSIVTRLMRDGKSRTLYKNIYKFYYKYILKFINKLPFNNEFKNLYFQHQSFIDFNRTLFWKLSLINSLFNIKRLKQRNLLYYVKQNRRITTTLIWLKYIIINNKFNNNNNTTDLYKPLINFICSNKQTNLVYSLKLKVYKLRLMRG